MSTPTQSDGGFQVSSQRYDDRIEDRQQNTLKLLETKLGSAIDYCKLKLSSKLFVLRQPGSGSANQLTNPKILIQGGLPDSEVAFPETVLETPPPKRENYRITSGPKDA